MKYSTIAHCKYANERDFITNAPREEIMEVYSLVLTSKHNKSMKIREKDKIIENLQIQIGIDKGKIDTLESNIEYYNKDKERPFISTPIACIWLVVIIIIKLAGL